MVGKPGRWRVPAHLCALYFAVEALAVSLQTMGLLAPAPSSMRRVVSLPRKHKQIPQLSGARVRVDQEYAGSAHLRCLFGYLGLKGARVLTYGLFASPSALLHVVLVVVAILALAHRIHAQLTSREALAIELEAPEQSTG